MSENEVLVGDFTIKIEEIPSSELKPKITDESKLGFGKHFTDRMFFMEYKDGKWHDPRIKKYEPFVLDPATLVFHYGQEIFEGMKAFRQQDGGVALFRPDMNAKRFNLSADRMEMPQVPEELFLEGIKTLVRLEQDWVPRSKGTALYIRPTMIATEVALGVHPSHSYYYYVILSPVGSYYAKGFAPTKIYISKDYVRAVRGGTGEAKTGGNYAASLKATKIAQELGYEQVLWLDAVERKYVEEVGSMNIFFVLDGELYTAPLTGSILHGVTRASVIQLAKDLGYTVHEKALSVDELIEGIKSGSLTESFGTGTAASISPVGEFYYDGEKYVVNNFEIGEITKELYEKLIGIQTGALEDPYGWVQRI